MTWVLGLLLWTQAASPAVPGLDDCGIPPLGPIAPFVAKDACLGAIEYADLNRDGIGDDAVAVLERRKAGTSESDVNAPRQVLVLTAQADGSLKLEKRNGTLLPCVKCGQTCFDSFQGIKAGPGKFTVEFENGCTTHETVEYTFGYSRRDKTWQLVKVKEGMGVYTPPKDFGKIDFADFDPESWKGKQ